MPSARRASFISLIGPRWLNAVDANGERRLDKPDDFVRLEIEAALRPEVRVIPDPGPGRDHAEPEGAPTVPCAAREAKRDRAQGQQLALRRRPADRDDRAGPGGGSGEDALDCEAAGCACSARARVEPGRVRRPMSPFPPRNAKGHGCSRRHSSGALAISCSRSASAFPRLSGSDGTLGREDRGRRRGDVAAPRRPEQKFRNNVLVATASVRLRGSQRGVDYRLNFTLEKRKGPAEPDRARSAPRT